MIDRLIEQAVSIVGPFIPHDRHKINKIKRNVVFTFVSQNIPRHLAVKGLAKKYEMTEQLIRYILRETYSNADEIIDLLPVAQDILCPDLAKWCRGTTHTLQTKDWYLHNIPKVSSKDDYDAAFNGTSIVYVARQGSRLHKRMRLCNTKVTVTDVIVKGFTIRGVYIAQDGSDHLFRVCEFQN